MHVQPQPDTDTVAVIQARMDRLDLMTRVLGCESDVARADLLGVSTKAIQRARSGYVSGRFVAGAIAGLRAHERELVARNLHPTFDELFRVLVVPIGADGDGGDE